MFCVYMILNVINGKIYVGQTTTPEKRWKRHILNSKTKNKFRHKLIHKAISKYGVESFQFSIIQYLRTKEDMIASEKYWISYYKSNVNRFGKEFGYNLTDGGETVLGMKHTEITKQKMSEAHKGIQHTEESRMKISKSNMGKHIGPTKETQEKITAILRANPNRLGAILSSKTKEKISKSKLGKQSSQETKDKISAAFTGSNHPNSRLTESEVIKIKQLINNGEKPIIIAKMFGISKNMVYKIKIGATWSHVII